MKQEEVEFRLLKQRLIQDTEDYLNALKCQTFDDYVDTDKYSRILFFKSKLINTAVNFGVYRFKACCSILDRKKHLIPHL